MSGPLRRRALAACLLALLVACQSELVPATQILVTVNSEFGSELATVEAQVFDVLETEASDTLTFELPSEVTTPFSFAIVPAPHKPVTSVLVVITGRDARGALLAETKALASFVARQKRGLDMALALGCRGKVCSASQTCSAMSFECSAAPEVDTHVIEPDAGTPGDFDGPAVSGQDAGGVVGAPARDAGSSRPGASEAGSGTAVDAGPTVPLDASSAVPDASGALDAGTRDGGSTSGADAGVADAGSTGGADAGAGDADADVDSGVGPTCCASGNCLCRGPDPSALTSANGAYRTATVTLSTGTAYYPTDAQPPFAGIALCAGFTNTGPEIADWARFYASHGIVTLVTTTGPMDLPDARADLLLASVNELKAENTKSGSVLFGKMSDRYGTSGYSMGGGATTLASAEAPSLRSSVGLAPWGSIGTGVTVPTLLLCGDADVVAPCTDYTIPTYDQIPAATAKMRVIFPGGDHLSWFDPSQIGGGLPARYALAFQKVFLEGDERWRPLLLTQPASGSQTTNFR